MLELKDTVEGMCSEDYKERFVAEYKQVSIRFNKLKKFVGRIKYAKYADQPEPEHACPVDLLECQLAIMKLYMEVLERRAEKYEHIELPEEDEE